MENSMLIIVLAIGTLVVVVGLGIVQFGRIRNSQAKRGETPGGIAGPSKD